MKVLVGYATVYGSTKEVAEKVGEVLKSKGMEVDVKSVTEISDVSAYDAAVIGAPVMKFSFLPPAKKFVKSNRDALSKIPVAYFSIGFKMINDTQEGRDWMMKKLKVVTKVVEPVDVGLFGGKYIKPEKGLKMPFPEGDWRDWDKITAWAEGLATKLK
ncbi:flavodoxin [candidate division WOR-3 bacterium]|uniref:Flavodoxin n=1 Tax=candidate division WOR-3 bacterium TaxID=2052148 RepID=A0A9D5K7L6_UNCW3|nr:flavodoxin [candidate division WOR-3 bacterium]MBD3363757.1 flavodoxin [candidate division WOR-3 bacterium]